MIRISKPPVNIREKLSELERPIGINGQALMATDTPQQAFDLLGARNRNRIINGDMRIDQRNAGASVTALDSYAVDRWQYEGSQTSKFTLQQNAGSVTPPAGFINYYGATSSSAYSVTASDFFFIGQRIEGFNVDDFALGTVNAKIVTLSFWVRSSLTGTFGGALSNSAGNRSYPFSYSISTANTWEQKSITIAGDTSGTWVTNNGLGLRVRFSLGAGSTWSSTAGAWAGANYISATGATSVVGTNGATWYITGVQLEAGKVATPFEHRSYGEELALCQRYYWKTDPNIDAYQLGQGFIRTLTTNANPVTIQVPYPVMMRTRPDVSVVPGTSNSFQAQVANTAHTASFVGNWAASGPNMGWLDFNTDSTSGWNVGDAVSVYPYIISGHGSLQFSAEL
jgi:hypothetical protein